MQTYCQLFYSKFAQYPREALRSKEGRSQIARAAKIIKAKDGRMECKYFLHLMTVSELIP